MIRIRRDRSGDQEEGRGCSMIVDKDGVTGDFVRSGNYDIEVAGVHFRARASLRPMYDPEGTRVRA